ncbi:MAG: lysoplasmalogenase family protein [Candidatus Thorarchaeota archaeon]
MSSSLKTPIGILRSLILIAILATVALLIIIVGESTPNWIFLSGSAMIVVLALVNYIDKKANADWSRFVLIMFFAMLVCFVADLLMAGVFAILPADNLINGVLFFALGHVVYLLALRNRSPLLLRSESPKLITRNLSIWILSIIAVFILFYLTLYNPSDMVISIGLFGYGIFLTSSLVFSITKWFDQYPRFFSISLILGFMLFFISDYILGIRILVDSAFLSGTDAVNITYLLGQMTVHLSSVFKTR